MNHVLSELRQREPFEGAASDHIRNGGYRIVTTIDKRAQDAAEAAADIRRATAPTPVRGQPANWQAALVAVEPGTGRVLAYYGGSNGTGADHAGWFLDDEGNPRGFGQHPPGSSFKVYDLAEALRQQVSLWSKWQSPAVKEFPASGRTRDTKAGPVRNSTSAKCQPNCTLWEATVASLNVTFFDLTERLGPANVIDMASRAGIDSMWTDRAGEQDPVRVDLRTKTGKELMAVSSGSSTGLFTTEVGIGQYGVTVLDHANGMATFAAGGKRAQAHFVREVTRRGERVYAESLTQANIGLTEEQVDELTWTLSQVPSAKLSNAWDAAGKTGTWQDASSTTRNAHTWMVGYTRSLATAVWLGTTDGKALITVDGKTDVFGSTHPAAIWRQFMTEATAALALDPKNRTFRKPRLAPSSAPPQPGALGQPRTRPALDGQPPPTHDRAVVARVSLRPRGKGQFPIKCRIPRAGYTEYWSCCARNSVHCSSVSVRPLSRIAASSRKYSSRGAPGANRISIDEGSSLRARNPWTPPIGTYRKSPVRAETHLSPS